MSWLLLLPALILLAGCSVTGCGADDDKLAKLKPGMSHEEAVGLMGCSGKLVSENGKSPGRFSTVEWRGPGALPLSRTYVVFLDDRVYTYSVEKRGGF